jgi:hypothetical protein
MADELEQIVLIIKCLRAPPVYVQTEPWEEYDSIGTLEQSNHSESFFGSEVADGLNDIE